MTAINKNQGNVKISEVAIDTAKALFSTLDNEDGLTFTNQVRNVLNNSLKKASYMLQSNGVLTWTGTSFDNNGNNLLLKFIQNPAGGTVTVTIPSSVLNTFTFANNEVLYLKLTRTQAASSFTAVAGDFTKANESLMPAAISPQSDAAQDNTLLIPLMARYDISSDQTLWWAPHGIYWPANTTSVVGAFVVTTTIPNGMILPLHRMGGDIPKGTPDLQTQEPGWALCDGGVVINVQSPYRNPGRDAEGYPIAGYSTSDDRYTPSLNGTPNLWANATAYVRGDAVADTALTKMWCALSNFTSSNVAGSNPNLANPPTWSAASSYSIGDFVIYADANLNGSGQLGTFIYQAVAANGPTATTPFDQGTAVWQRIWTTGATQNANPFRRSAYNNSLTVNAPSTFIRGNVTSLAGLSAYGGAATVVLVAANLPAHDHTIQGVGTHGHSVGTALNTNVGVPAGGYTAEGGGGAAFHPPGGINLNHGHSISPDGSHSHPIPLSGGSGGPSGDPHNNEPRYLSAAYIMKVF